MRSIRLPIEPTQAKAYKDPPPSDLVFVSAKIYTIFMGMVDVSIVISILSLIISITVGYMAYFRRGRLYFSVPSKIGIQKYSVEQLIICFPVVVVNSGVLSKTINRLHAEIVSIETADIDKYVLDAVFQWDHFPPGSNDLYESISPIIVPSRYNVKVPIGLISRDNVKTLSKGHYKFILYASIGPKLFKKPRLKEVLRFKFEGSYGALGRINNGIWEFYDSDHDDPNT